MLQFSQVYIFRQIDYSLYSTIEAPIPGAIYEEIDSFILKSIYTNNIAGNNHSTEKGLKHFITFADPSEIIEIIAKDVKLLNKK